MADENWCFFCDRFLQKHSLSMYVWTDAMLSDVAVCEEHAANFLTDLIDDELADFVGPTRVRPVGMTNG